MDVLTDKEFDAAETKWYDNHTPNDYCLQDKIEHDLEITGAYK